MPPIDPAIRSFWVCVKRNPGVSGGGEISSDMVCATLLERSC